MWRHMKLLKSYPEIEGIRQQGLHSGNQISSYSIHCDGYQPPSGPEGPLSCTFCKQGYLCIVKAQQSPCFIRLPRCRAKCKGKEAVGKLFHSR